MNDTKINDAEASWQEYKEAKKEILEKFGEDFFLYIPYKPNNMIEKELNNILTDTEARYYELLKKNKSIYLKAQIELEKRLKSILPYLAVDHPKQRDIEDVIKHYGRKK